MYMFSKSEREAREMMKFLKENKIHVLGPRTLLHGKNHYPGFYDLIKKIVETHQDDKDLMSKQLYDLGNHALGNKPIIDENYLGKTRYEPEKEKFSAAQDLKL